MMLHHILKFKQDSINILLEGHLRLIKILIGNVSKSTDIVLLSSTLDFLSTLNEAKMLP